MEFVNANKVYRKSGEAHRSLSLHGTAEPRSLTLSPNHGPRVPHISLVFREMWDTTAPHP